MAQYLFPAKDIGELPPGMVSITGYDHAGNSSQQFSFSIPDLSAININSANAIYNNFSGISETTPSTLERSHTFDFSDPMAGVSAVRIDGPSGNLVSWDFNPPVPSTSTALSDLPVGNYTATALNSVGEETRTPFIGNSHFSLVGNHTIAFNQSLTAEPLKVSPTIMTLSASHTTLRRLAQKCQSHAA